MPGFSVFFCPLTIFIVQLLCFHVPLFVCPMISSVMKATPTIILFLAEWILVVLISRVFIGTTILNARNDAPKPILLSQTSLPTISDDDRDAEARTENCAALVERKPKRGKKVKKKTLEVNYEKRLGEFHCDPSML